MVTCTDFVPKVCPQIQTRPSAGDCGPCAVVEALHIASCGRFRIGDRARRIDLVERIRRLGGSPATGSTKNAEMQKAFTSTYFANQFAALGLRPPRASRVFLGADWTDDFPRPQLLDGKWVSISVRYTDIDAWNDGAVTGQHGYTGPHQLVIGEYRVKGGNAWVTMVDPLADGRIDGSGQRVADGPQAIRLSVIQSAAADYAGSGNASGYAFWPVALLPGTDPGTGGGTTTVPDVVDVAEATALAAFTSAGLVAGNREEAYHATIVTGNVISTDPVAATTVQVASSVDYVVSLGTAPAAPAFDPDPPDPCTDPSGDVVFARRARPCGCGD